MGFVPEAMGSVPSLRPPHRSIRRDGRSPLPFPWCHQPLEPACFCTHHLKQRMDTSASLNRNLQRGNLRIDLLRYEVGTALIKWEVRTKKYVKRANMPKRYTPVTAAADLEKALRLLEGRWKLVIFFPLLGGKIMRFSCLERAIPAITQKMLGQQLKALEADGIVLRTAYPQVPPKVEYRLTSWGQSLCPALYAMLKWADGRPERVRKVSETR